MPKFRIDGEQAIHLYCEVEADTIEEAFKQAKELPYYEWDKCDNVIDLQGGENLETEEYTDYVEE